MRLTRYYNMVRVVRRGVLTLVFLLVLVPAGAEVRIMLVSDPHVMGPGLLVSEGEAWNNAIYSDRKLNDYSRAIFDEIIGIAIAEKPDLFLISGDLTKDGELLSHQYVVKKLYELKDAGIKAFVIPGNHDMGTSNALYYDGDLIRDADTINTRQFADMYKDFGYGDDIDREPTTLTWCCEPVKGLVLIGIDTGHEDDPLNGVIPHVAFEWVCDRAEKATKAGKQVLVMMHHPLFPHVTNAEKFSSTYAVKLGMPIGDGSYAYYSYATMRNHLADAGVGVVLSGHVHVSDIAKDSNKYLTRTIHDICTSTCAAYPNPYRLLTLNEDEATMRIQTRYIQELPGVEDFKTLSENRMTLGLQNLAKHNTQNKDVFNYFTEIFKVHIAGNEAEHPQQQAYLNMYEEYLSQMKEDEQICDYLDTYGVTFDELTQMVYSILEDKSNYGDADRENVLDDLDTTISVRGDNWTAIRRLESEVRNWESGWYTLQGIRIPKPERQGVYIHKDTSGTKLIHKH